MPRPRSKLISLHDTPFYHCSSRCVRRAFLCGIDHYSGQSYEHRRGWLEKKLLFVSNAFAIKVCAYAIMSNHYHVVLHVRPDIGKAWSDWEVVHRWHRLFRGTPLSSKFLEDHSLSEGDRKLLQTTIDLWRGRLMDISWLMRIVNESIARRANEEDDCTGCFWQARFSSQGILEDRALIAGMTYVDLNPIRAGIATLPESSDFTSIKKRIDGILNIASPPPCLKKFTGGNSKAIGIPFTLQEYIDLVEWTGRLIHPDKKGYIPEDEPALLARMNIDVDAWCTLTTEFEKRFKSWVGSEHRVQQLYQRQGYRHKPSTAQHRKLFS